MECIIRRLDSIYVHRKCTLTRLKIKEMLKPIIIFAVLSLSAQSVYARSNPVDNPEMIPFIFIVGISAVLIGLISNAVSKLSKGKSLLSAFALTLGGLGLIILVLYVCIILLIQVADKFGM